MSYQAVEWAIKRAPVPSSSALLVLVILAETADADGTKAFPSRSTIEYRSRLSKSTVKRALADLEKSGLIVRAGTVGDGVVNWTLMMHHERPASDLAGLMERVEAERVAKAERMAKLRAERRGGHSDPHKSGPDNGCGGQREPHISDGSGQADEVCGHSEPHVGVTMTARGGHSDPVNHPGTSQGTVSVFNTGAASLAPASATSKAITARAVVAAWERGRKDGRDDEGFSDERQRGLVQKEAKRLVAEGEHTAEELLYAAEEAGRRGDTTEGVLAERVEASAGFSPAEGASPDGGDPGERERDWADELADEWADADDSPAVVVDSQAGRDGELATDTAPTAPLPVPAAPEAHSQPLTLRDAVAEVMDRVSGDNGLSWVTPNAWEKYLRTAPDDPHAVRMLRRAKSCDLVGRVVA